MTTYWSRDGEDYRYDSFQELLGAYDDLEEGDIVHFGEGEHCDPGEWISADDVIEQMACRAYDECGEFAEGYPEVPSEAKAELNELLAAWARKHCTPTFYVIRDAQDYEITAADIEEFNK